MTSAGNRSIALMMVLFLAIIIGSFAVFYFMGISHDTQTLTEDQKLKAEEIALNDSIVQGKIHMIQYKFFSQDGWKYNMSNPVFYTVGNITMGKVHEIAPGIDRIRYLPSVELIFGHSDLSDINLYAYVDLEKGRVAYIGFTGRSGPSAAGYYYSPSNDGVVEHIENNGWARDYGNITILDTPYKANQPLTDVEKSGLLNVAKKNETVMDFLNGTAGRGETYEYQYTIYSDENEMAGHHYVIARPNIYVSVKEPDGSYGRKYLMVNLDGMGNTVTSADIGEMFMPPPTQMPPGNLP